MSSFVQKTHLRTNYIESNNEEYIDLKNQFYIEKLRSLFSPQEAPPKAYVDYKINDLFITKNSARVDFNDENLNNVRFDKVNSLPSVREHFTTQYFVDKAISNSKD